MSQSKSLPSATVYAFDAPQHPSKPVVFGSLGAKGVTQGASDMCTMRAPVQRPVQGSLTGAILVVTGTPERYAALPGHLEFIEPDIVAICAAAGRGDVYRAILAELVGPDGRELGYRAAQLLRTQFMFFSCPIFLISACPTASARAYALQCGATTKLMRDDEDLVEDLLQFGLAVATPKAPG